MFKKIIGGGSLLLTLCTSAWASSGTIPTPPSSDQITSSQDMLGVMTNISQSEMFPLLIDGAEISLLIGAIIALITGYQETKKTGDWGAFVKHAILAAVMITLGGIIAYYAQSINNGL